MKICNQTAYTVSAILEAWGQDTTKIEFLFFTPYGLYGIEISGVCYNNERINAFIVME